MTRLGFHASHEQIAPGQLLQDVQAAERAGFQMAMCSDHFVPWSSAQGHSGHTWSWLGAALATTNLAFGCVTAPGQRYHPAVLAQAIATLGAMFPGRFWAALASGEAMNENITGDAWPRKEVREQRLDECVGIISRLLDGEEVSHDGLVTVNQARLWDLPEEKPLLIGPAVSAESAARIAAWADGLVTVNQSHETLRRVIDAYRGAGGRGRLALQLHLSWAPSLDEAERIAHDQWAGNAVGAPLTWDIATVEGFDVAASHVTLDDVRKAVRISEDPARHVAWIQEYAALGFDDIYLHFVGQDQQPYLDEFGSKVLPEFA
ncbi:TIGR03885 family FMN-dependent LLM class oxidoreductase [Tessaracoccus lubricantis]